MIERRRAPEFAAAAAAGEDDDDDDDDAPDQRRGSTKGKQGGPPGPGKSLKGKDTYKSRQPSRQDYAKGKRRRRERARDGSERRGFIEGLMSHSSSDEDDDEKPNIIQQDRPRHDSVSSDLTLHCSNETLTGPRTCPRCSTP